MVYEDFTLLITTQETGWNKWQHHSNEWKWTSYVRSTLLSSALDCRRWRTIRPDCVHTSSDWETALTTSRSRTDITVAAYQIRLRISTAGRIFPIFTMGREMPSKIAHFRGGILPPPTHPFNGPLSGTTQVSRYQKGKTNLDFTKAGDSEWHWQWHQLDHMQVCTSL